MTLDDAVRYEIAGSWWADRVSWNCGQWLLAYWFTWKARRKYRRYQRHIEYRAKQRRIADDVLQLLEAVQRPPSVVPIFTDIKFNVDQGYYFAHLLDPATRQPVNSVYLGSDIESAEKWYNANVPPAQRENP